MMARNIDPLNNAVPIADAKTGFPTPFFLRQWQNLLALVLSVTSVENTAVPQSRLINTTAPIAGGGDLSADRTITHNDTAVTPGTYRGLYTVDQKGHITAAVNTTRLNGPFTVATLPGAPTQGDTAFVTDAAAPAFGAAVAGGGAVVIPVFYNGAAWIVA
jgi:hypothetical protein